MLLKLGVLASLASLGLIFLGASPAAAALTFYDSQAAFDAAYPGEAHTDFSSLTSLTEPTGIYEFPGAQASVGGDTFVANQYLFALIPAAVGSPYSVTFLSSQSEGPQTNFLSISTHAADAFGIDIGSYGTFPLTVTATLNTGESFQMDVDDTPQFIGFASSLGPITSIHLSGLFDDGEAGATVIDLLDVSQEDVVTAPTPEPSAWLLMLTGLGFLGAAVRRQSARRPL